jgi:hypothetical protein
LTVILVGRRYAVAVLPDAKGLFPESHEGFVGTYWGAVSSPCCCETVEAADLVITAGGALFLPARLCSLPAYLPDCLPVCLIVCLTACLNVCLSALLAA